MTLLLIAVTLVIGAVLGFLIAVEAAGNALTQAMGWGSGQGRSLPLWILMLLVLGLVGWFVIQHIRIV